MRLYWKLDNKDTQNILYAGSFDMIKLLKGQKMHSSENPQNKTLLSNFGHREDIDFIFDPSKKRTLLKFKNVKCLHCHELKIPEKFIAIKNEFLIDYYKKREGVQIIEKKVKKELTSFQKARQKPSMTDYLGTEHLISEYFTANCQLPLYYRRKYDINQFNRDAKDLFSKNLKFTKFDTSLVCLECYLDMIEFFTKNEHTNVNLFATIDERPEIPQAEKQKQRLEVQEELLEKRTGIKREDARVIESDLQAIKLDRFGEASCGDTQMPSRIVSADKRGYLNNIISEDRPYSEQIQAKNEAKHDNVAMAMINRNYDRDKISIQTCQEKYKHKLPERKNSSEVDSPFEISKKDSDRILLVPETGFGHKVEQKIEKEWENWLKDETPEEILEDEKAVKQFLLENSKCSAHANMNVQLSRKRLASGTTSGDELYYKGKMGTISRLPKSSTRCLSKDGGASSKKDMTDQEEVYVHYLLSNTLQSPSYYEKNSKLTNATAGRKGIQTGGLLIGKDIGLGLSDRTGNCIRIVGNQDPQHCTNRTIHSGVSKSTLEDKFRNVNYKSKDHIYGINMNISKKRNELSEQGLQADSNFPNNGKARAKSSAGFRKLLDVKPKSGVMMKKQPFSTTATGMVSKVDHKNAIIKRSIQSGTDGGRYRYQPGHRLVLNTPLRVMSTRQQQNFEKSTSQSARRRKKLEKERVKNEVNKRQLYDQKIKGQTNNTTDDTYMRTNDENLVNTIDNHDDGLNLKELSEEIDEGNFDEFIKENPQTHRSNVFHGDIYEVDRMSSKRESNVRRDSDANNDNDQHNIDIKLNSNCTDESGQEQDKSDPKDRLSSVDQSEEHDLNMPRLTEESSDNHTSKSQINTQAIEQKKLGGIKGDYNQQFHSERFNVVAPKKDFRKRKTQNENISDLSNKKDHHTGGKDSNFKTAVVTDSGTENLDEHDQKLQQQRLKKDDNIIQMESSRHMANSNKNIKHDVYYNLPINEQEALDENTTNFAPLDIQSIYKFTSDDMPEISINQPMSSRFKIDKVEEGQYTKEGDENERQAKEKQHDERRSMVGAQSNRSEIQGSIGNGSRRNNNPEPISKRDSLFSEGGMVAKLPQDKEADRHAKKRGSIVNNEGVQIFFC